MGDQEALVFIIRLRAHETICVSLLENISNLDPSDIEFWMKQENRCGASGDA